VAVPTRYAPSAPPALTGFGARAGPVVDRTGSFLEEPPPPAVPHSDDLRDDRLGDLIRSLGAEIETGRPVDPRALLVGDLHALLRQIHQDPLGPRGGSEHPDVAHVGAQQAAQEVPAHTIVCARA